MYQLFVQLLEPFTLISLCLMAALAWVWRRQPRTFPLIAVTVAVGGLVVMSLPATGYLAMRSLESAYPPGNEAPAPGDTLVVLSAGLILENVDPVRVRLDYASAERCLHAVRLYKRAGRCRIVMSGGKTDEADPSPALAEAMRQFVVDLEIRPEDILLEDRSLTTYENALYSRALLNEDTDRSIWLVTAASHMNRAERCFRKQGFVVTPAPCDHQTEVWEYSFKDFIPSAGGLHLFTRAVHEWHGRIWYRLRGKL